MAQRPFPQRPGPTRRWRAGRLPLLGLALLAGAGAFLTGGTGTGPAPAAAGLFGTAFTAPDVADLLYTRYHMARVMRVVPTGDVFQADAVDRRGYRVHFTIDAYNGQVLESFVVGRVAYEPAVPVPPGLVPNVSPGYGAGVPSAQLPPPSRDELVRPDAPRQTLPPRSRQARTPDPASPVSPPRVKQTPAPKPPAPAPAEPAPATAARQPGEKSPAAAPAPVPDAVSPPTQAVAPAKPSDAAKPEPRSAEVKQAGPATRLPEPLIDPKTGKAPTTVPVAPLDDATPATKAPITIMPPAPLE